MQDPNLVEMFKTMNDNEIRLWLRKNENSSNYGYCIHVCRGCGETYHNGDGKAETCKITQVCRDCIVIE